MNLARITDRSHPRIGERPGLSLCLLPLLLALWAAAPAQVEDADTESAPGMEDAQEEDSETLQEIVVVGARSGDPKRLDNAYENALRQRIMDEIDELEALQEEFDWRRSARDDDESRIRWGYDPRDEFRARRESELYDLPLDDNRPATIFSIEF